MRLILFSLIFFCLNGYAQETNIDVVENGGIIWEKGLSWEQIKEKAKKVNKLIFVDCYATWCGPCKRMDEEVYIDDSVGRYMNEKFINVRVQMDRTKKDDENIQSWYKEADNMRIQHKIKMFPSYLFFNADGLIIHRDISYVTSDKFLDIAASASDPKNQFYTVKSEYEKGKKDYVIMEYLVNKAKRLGDWKFAERCKNDYLDHLLKQPEKVVYKKENISFIASAIPSTKSPWLRIFINNKKRINDLMQESGFCQRVVDSAIDREYINPAFAKLRKGQSPNFDSLYKVIEKENGAENAKRNITWRKVNWFTAMKDTLSCVKYFIQLVKMGGMDTSFYRSDLIINSITYIHVFNLRNEILAENPDILPEAIRMMEGVIKRADRIMRISKSDPKKDSSTTLSWKGEKMDTYAYLLYKSARIDEAIAWEQKALQVALDMSDTGRAVKYRKVIEDMQGKKL